MIQIIDDRYQFLKRFIPKIKCLWQRYSETTQKLVPWRNVYMSLKTTCKSILQSTPPYLWFQGWMIGTSLRRLTFHNPKSATSSTGIRSWVPSPAQSRRAWSGPWIRCRKQWVSRHLVFVFCNFSHLLFIFYTMHSFSIIISFNSIIFVYPFCGIVLRDIHILYGQVLA